MKNGRVGKIITTALYIFGAIIIGLAGIIFIQNQNPKIDLGLENGQLKEIPLNPNCVSTQTSQEEKLIEPLQLKDSLEKSKTAMKMALESYGGIEIVEEKDNYIYAVATTGGMKFHDDIEIYFDQVNGVIQYRSASRAGKSDMGLNRERYEDIVEVYNK